MIYRNIEFHNAEELIPCEKGLAMSRIPASLREQVNPVLRTRSAFYSTGVELRFRLVGDQARICLQADEMDEAQVACIYMGSFQGGWKWSTKVIGTSPTWIEIPKPSNLDNLRRITEEKKLPFSPEIIRIVLPYGLCYFVDSEGEIVPPRKEELPARTYLAYGSSITHGSLALVQPYSYPFRIAQRLKCDYLNLGFAGTAFLEPAMAEYIISRKDWDFASVEMGVNLLKNVMDLKEFEERVDVFTQILARDPRPVFATSIFGLSNSEQQAVAADCRRIVAKYASERLIFTDGLDLLDREDYISQDMVHPSLEGLQQIAERWGGIMARYFENNK